MKKLLTNNIGYKLISVVFAVVLWVVVVNISDPTVTRTISGIPVIRTDESVLTAQGKVYVVLEGNSATISVKGPRSIVDGLDSDDFVAEAPFSEMTNANAVPIYVSHKYSRYEKSVEIIQKTRTMVLSIEDIDTKYFDIEVNYIGEPASGYSVGTTKLSNTFVKVTAPVSILDQISQARVDVDITKLKGNMESELVIKYYSDNGKKVDLGEYATTSVSAVKANVIIYQITEVPITASVTGNVAEGYEYIGMELSRDTVAIEGENASQIDSIVLPNDLLSIDDAREDITLEIDISKYLPQGIRLHNDDDKMVTVTLNVERYITGSYDLPVENIELRNLAENLEADYTDSSIKLRLVGLRQSHDDLSVNDIVGYVDLSEAQPGTRNYPVTLNLPEGISLGDEARIRITVRRKSPPEETTDKEATIKETDKETTTQEETTTEEDTSEENITEQ